MSIMTDDDEFYSFLRRVHPNQLFGTAWAHKDIDYPGYYPITALSFHLSELQRQEFRHELYTSYDKKYGKRVPPSYYTIEKQFSIIASPELHDFTTETTQLNKKGVVVCISTLKYLPRLGLTQPHDYLDNLIQQHGSEYSEQLMTKNKVLAEIKDDTNRWYQDLTNPTNDTGWIDITNFEKPSSPK